MGMLGQRIKALRKFKGISQGDLGDSIGVAFSTISAIENGRSEAIETVGAIADYFKVSKEWLINGEGIAPKGVVIPVRKDAEENPWKDALVQELKSEVDRLKAQNEKLIDMLNRSWPGKAANFLKALTKAGATAKVVRMPLAGAQVGAQAS